MQIKAKKMSVFSATYWRAAADHIKDIKIIVYAALIIALRVVVKGLKIPIIPGVSLAFDCYVNSLGSIVYGPVVALLVGAVSDTLGCVLFPSPYSPYFFPFIFVEMASSFIFALIFWKRRISPLRAIFAKFTVNLVCNVILTSLLVKWQYTLLGQYYPLINGVRIVKSMILFPLEAMLIVIILSAASPVLKASRLMDENYMVFDPKDKRSMLKIGLQTVLFLAISVSVILFYVFFLKDFMSANNFKLL